MGLLQKVNIRQGTASTPRFSRGNTLPLTQMPHGMVSLTLQTDGGRGNWFYHPQDRSLEGIRLTHQPSPWMGDYGQILFTPQWKTRAETSEERWSGFDPAAAKLTPALIEVEFLRARTAVQAVPTQRCAVLQVLAEKQDTCLTVTLPGGPGQLRLSADGQWLTGFTGQATDGAPENFKEYFAVACVPALETAEITADRADGENCCLHLPLPAGRRQVFRVGTSFISLAQAKVNLAREVGGQDASALQNVCEQTWEALLGRIEITAEEARQRTFYSCLYRALLFPRIFYEISSEGQALHVSMKDNSVRAGVQYTDNGYWDTYRSQYPLLALVEPERYGEIVAGCLNFYNDTGWLPRWLSPGERGTMPGTLIDGVLADAAVKGFLTQSQMETALEGMLKHAGAGDGCHGRVGGADYQALGYLPADRYAESVSTTLDYAYGDACIAVLANLLGKADVAARFTERSHGYRKLLDSKSGLLRPRGADGSAIQPWSEYAWGGAYCEGGPWQSSFQIAFDLEGWIAAQGGREKCLALLDALFARPPYYEVGGYGKEIHEMTEMALARFGQCAISNQPSFLTPYLYALLGAREKSAAVLSDMLATAFSDGEEGYPGDEDNGSLAAWYVFGALGLYPACPGKAQYVLTKPQMPKAVLHLPGGKELLIQPLAQAGPAAAQSEACFVTHRQVLAGGSLEF